MSILKRKYGTKNGTEVFAYTLDNNNGLKAEILTLGGIITRLSVFGVDVVFGRNNLEEYLDNKGCYGALTGRNTNRISNARFVLEDKVYELCKNHGNNNIHGGKENFSTRIWNAESIDCDEPALVLSLFSKDGEEGFPGNLKVNVTYTLTKNNGLKIHYEGISDATTILNMTNHSYFNLNGHDSGTIDLHSFMLESEFYTPNKSDDGTPTGEVLKTKGTPYDFTEGKTFKDVFDMGISGIDQNFVLKEDKFHHCATLKGDKTGIVMKVYTDRPGLQVYTCSCNVVDNTMVYKDGASYCVRGAVCLETQGFPNSINIPHFPKFILNKGEKYDTVTEYRFEK